MNTMLKCNQRLAISIAVLAACIIWQLTAAAALQASERTELPPLQPGSKVLVMPFNCNILPPEYEEAQKVLQTAITSRTIHLLRSAGVEVEEFSHAGQMSGKRPAPVKAVNRNNAAAYAQNAEPAEAFLPLTPDSRVEQTADGSLTAVPRDDGQWDEPREAAFSAGTEPEPQSAEDGVVSAGIKLLEPADFADVTEEQTGTALTDGAQPAEEAGQPGQTVAGEAGQSVRAAAATQEPAVVLAQGDVIYGSEASGILETANMLGYDYVLAGNVSYVHAELKPAVRVAGREVSSVRGELSCSYRLLSSEQGQVLATGAVTGKAAKQISLTGGELGQMQIDNAFSRVINQALYIATQNLVRELLDPNALHPGDWESDANYYRDSPGKRLKP